MFLSFPDRAACISPKQTCSHFLCQMNHCRFQSFLIFITILWLWAAYLSVNATFECCMFKDLCIRNACADALMILSIEPSFTCWRGFGLDWISCMQLFYGTNCLRCAEKPKDLLTSEKRCHMHSFSSVYMNNAKHQFNTI